MDSANGHHADLLVVGAGMAGLTAAAYLASRGGVAVVVEKATEIGGSAALSGGKLWTAPSLESLRTEDPGGDTRLAACVVEDFPLVVEWIRSVGVDVSNETTIPGGGVGYDFDILHYLQQCRRLVEGAGGAIVRNATVTELLVDHGRVIGGRIVDRDGSSDVGAADTLLATGGFQASSALRRTYIHPHAGEMLLRSNVHSTGDGLRLGLSVGAAQVVDPTGFYGHLVCAPMKELQPKDFTRLAQYYSASCLLFNAQGRRFCNESKGDHYNTQALVKEADRRGLLFADHNVYVRRACVSPSSQMESVDKFAEAAAAGANTACVDEIDQLEAVVGQWGFLGSNVVAAIHAFNAWCEDREGPPETFRTRKIRPLTNPPFHVLEVSPAISFTFGGLRVDECARVLDQAGVVIPGLRAAGADGCAFVHGYAGGLAMSAGFALRSVGAVVQQT